MYIPFGESGGVSGLKQLSDELGDMQSPGQRTMTETIENCKIPSNL